MMHTSPEALAGYLDNGLSVREQQEVERHLASCAECRAELAEVRRLERAHGRRRRVLLLVPLGAAAALALLIALPGKDSTRSDFRAGAVDEGVLDVIAPAPGAQIAAGSINFLWHSAGSGASYTITLQEADGRPIWTSAESDTVAELPDSVALSPGRTWYWVVDALLPDGRSLSTTVNRFTTRP